MITSILIQIKKNIDRINEEKIIENKQVVVKSIDEFDVVLSTCSIRRYDRSR